MIRALMVVALLAGCGSVDVADVPPAGDIWFGDTFDPNTFAISDRMESVSASEGFALVGTVPEAIDADELSIRASLDGQQFMHEAANATGSGEVWGFTWTPVHAPGTLTIEYVDIGGNVLASGTIEVTPTQ